MSKNKSLALCSISMFLLCLVFSSCQKRKAPVTFEKVLTASLEYILFEEDMAPEYYRKPLQIIRPARYAIRSRIVVFKKECILLPKDTNVDHLLEGMDVFRPIPLVEIMHYNNVRKNIYITIRFRATGPVYEMTLDGDDEFGYKVIRYSYYLT